MRSSFHFNPRSPCGERLVCHLPIPFVMGISIHALLAESDRVDLFPAPRAAISIHALLAESDQRTLPLPPSPPQISIHALLAESDPFPREECPSPPYFNPRSPCGERPEAAIKDALNITFQSTLSLRRATGEVLQRLPFGFISIHALLAESDRRSQRDPPLP